MIPVTSGKGWNEKEAIDLLRNKSHRIDKKKDLDLLIEKIGEAKIVMLGEATHGTHEFYTWRTHISQELIKKKGFDFIAVEGDWPDCYRINQYIIGEARETRALEVLITVKRWRSWWWARWETGALADWLSD